MKTIFLITDHTLASQRYTALHTARTMKQRGEPATIVCSGDEDIRAPFLEAGLSVVRSRLGGMLDIFSPLKVSKLIETGDRAVIVVFDFKSMLSATRIKNLGPTMRATVKLVFMMPGYGYSRISPEKRRQIAQEVDAVVLPFSSAADRLNFFSGALFKDKIKVVHPGVPSPTLSSNEEKTVCEARSTGPETVKMIFTGEILPERGLNNLIALLELITPLPCYLTVVGTGQGRYVMPILRHSRSIGVDKHILWAGDNPSISKFLTDADLGIAPSVAPCDDYISILLMLSYGLPVITTPDGYGDEIRALLPSGNDRVKITGDNSAPSLAKAVKEFSAGSRSAEGDTYLGEFDFVRFYDRFYSLLLSLFTNE